MMCGPRPAPPLIVPQPQPSRPGSGWPSYWILKITDWSGSVRYVAVETHQLASFEKQIYDQYLRVARERKSLADGDSCSPLPKPLIERERQVQGRAGAWEEAQRIVAIYTERERQRLKGEAAAGKSAARDPKQVPAKEVPGNEVSAGEIKPK